MRADVERLVRVFAEAISATTGARSSREIRLPTPGDRLAISTRYVPQLDTYIGPETPNPLFITVLRSKNHPIPELKSVLNDIMGLTKINYNSCNFNDGLPVTVRFAQMVGEVLTMGAAKGAEKQPFKFYI